RSSMAQQLQGAGSEHQGPDPATGSSGPYRQVSDGHYHQERHHGCHQPQQNGARRYPGGGLVAAFSQAYSTPTSVKSSMVRSRSSRSLRSMAGASISAKGGRSTDGRTPSTKGDSYVSRAKYSWAVSDSRNSTRAWAASALPVPARTATPATFTRAPASPPVR